MPANRTWTDERKAEAKRLYFDEGLSAARVARRMGIPSRNAVISVLHRMGLVGKGSTPRRGIRACASRDLRPPSPPRPAPAIAIGRAAAFALEPFGAPDESPPAGKCRFTADDVGIPGWRMCGRDGFPWCEAHRKVVYVPNYVAQRNREDLAKAEQAEEVTGIKRISG